MKFISYISLSSPISNSDGTKSIFVNTNNQVTVTGQELLARYNIQSVQIVSILTTTRSSGMNLPYSAENGNLKIGLFSPNGSKLISAGSGSVIKITYKQLLPTANPFTISSANSYDAQAKAMQTKIINPLTKTSSPAPSLD